MDDLKGLHAIKKGSYVNDGITYSGGNQSKLLYAKEGFEALIEIMPKGTVGCFYTMTKDAFLFDYIIKGKIELRSKGKIDVLQTGDTYYYGFLEENIMFRVLEDTEILSVNTDPCYDQYHASIKVLNDILENLQKVDDDTLRHCNRVKELCLGIAYFCNFDEKQLLNLFYAATFHDVGKAKIPVEILLKPARLTNQEYEIMKNHSLYTYEMIRQHYGEDVANIAFEHHEHLDGRGYPRGLKGDEISLAARILTVADAYDAMVITRPYRVAFTKEEALKELRRCEGTQFDSRVVDALEKYLHQ